MQEYHLIIEEGLYLYLGQVLAQYFTHIPMQLPLPVVVHVYELMLQDYFNKLETGSLPLLTGSWACNVLKDLTLTTSLSQ